MNILIDTHILIWSLNNHKKLKPSERDLLLSPDTTIYVSTISLWEIALKYQTNKLALQSLDMTNIQSGVAMNGFQIITLSTNEAISFHQLPHQDNTDPFDRMLMWQAICNQYYFMSRDRKVKTYTKFGLKLV